jgi:signal transduction histidine kinase/DNA-binding response OmpR family regulator
MHNTSMSKNVARTSGSARVLIVDDHPNTASMLARVIRKIGPQVEVITASSGEDALQQLGDNIADVLITDFMMPGMSGLELIERLNDGRKPGYTILVTAYHTPGLATTARRLDIQNYLVKPVDPVKVRDLVAGAVENILPYRGTQQGNTRQRPFKILIADDYPDNIRLLSVRLRNEGYDHVVATDGQEALDKLRTEKPDMALLDVNMPNKDGFEVVKEMRNDPEIAHIPAIMITAARMGVKDVQEGLALGADDYVTKPVDWRELSARIRAKLRVKQAEDDLRARNLELGVLPEISQDLGERLDIEDLTKSLLSRTVKAINAQNGHLVIFHNDGTTTFQLHKIFDFSPWNFGQVQDEVASQGVVSRVFSNGEEVIITDVEHEADWLAIPNDPTKSAISVPLMGRQAVIGVLTLTHSQPNHFKSDHLTILKAIASQAAIAVENAQLYATERKRVNELVALNQVTRDVGQFSESSQLYEKLPVLIKQALGYPAVALWLVENSALKMESIAGADNVQRQSLLEIGPNQAAKTGQPVQLSGSIDERLANREDSSGDPPVQSVIAVPLMKGSEVKGVLSIHSNRASAFHESDRVLLETLTSQVITVLERILLFETNEQEKQRLAAVLNGAADAILVFDNHNNLQLANPEGLKLFTDMDTRIGKPIPADQGYDNLIKILDQACQNCMEDETEISWPDERIFSIMVTPIEDGGQVVVLHDVSHFKALDRIKNEFIATASHDLKNPIHAVLGYSDLLSKAGPMNDMQIDFADRIQRAAIQMNELVLNMLELVRVDLGMTLQPEKLDLKNLLESVVDDMVSQANMKNQKFTMQPLSKRPQVIGDAAQLRQVLRNLIGNAIKYTPENGQINVETAMDLNQIWIEIKDSGYGISKDELPFIFDKFYRSKTEDTKDIEGNGLGLAIVKAIVEQHQGEVAVDSILGEGSTFSFCLPITNVKEPTQPMVAGVNDSI